MEPRQLEYVCLQPEITDRQIDEAVRMAKGKGLAALVVPPFWVKRARREIGEHPLLLCSVAGYPYGYNMTETKVEEIKWAIKYGASEIEVCINLSGVKIRMDWVKIELAKCSKLIHDSNCFYRIRLDGSFLTEEEIFRNIKIAGDVGVDYITLARELKPGLDTTPELIAEIRKHLIPDAEIIAHTSSPSLASFQSLISAGAFRVGLKDAGRIV